MKKNVLILSSSPRRHGNSDLLCDRFLEGAKDAGHNVEKIFLKDKDINIELRELSPLRDLRIIKGNIEDLICEGRDVEEGKEDYIQAILTDDGELMNPMEKLKAVYPNTMLITRERKRNVSEGGAVAKGEFRKKSKIDLFKDF